MKKLLSVIVVAAIVAGMTMTVFADGVDPTTPADPATPPISADPVNPAKPENPANPKIMPFAGSGKGFARMHRTFGFGAPCPSPKGVPAPRKAPLTCPNCKATLPEDGAAAGAARNASKLDAIWAKISGLTVDEAVAQGLITREQADKIKAVQSDPNARKAFKAGLKIGRGAARGVQVNGPMICRQGIQGIQGIQGMLGMPGVLGNCVRMMRRMSR